MFFTRLYSFIQTFNLVTLTVKSHSNCNKAQVVCAVVFMCFCS